MKVTVGGFPGEIFTIYRSFPAPQDTMDLVGDQGSLLLNWPRSRTEWWDE